MAKDSDRLDDDEAEDDSPADLTITSNKLRDLTAIPAKEEAEPEPVVESNEDSEPEAKPEMPAGVDPLDRKFTWSDVQKEAKRLKDEYAGKLGWVSKNVKQRYGGKQQEFESTLAKGEKYDALEARLKDIESKVANKVVESPKAEPGSESGDKAKPKLDSKTIAKTIVEKRGLQETAGGPIEDILSAVDEYLAGRKDINEGKGPAESQADFERRMMEMEWNRARQWAEAQEDYRTMPAVQIRAEYRARTLHERPDVALQNTRKELGLNKPVKQIAGKPAVGKPALAKDNSAGSSSAIEYDGKTDPMDLLKKAWKK